MRAWLIAICLAAAVPAAASASARTDASELRRDRAVAAYGSEGGQDLDRDGLPDRLEQALLERFAPTLLLTANECDDLPASFTPFSVEPRVRAKDATLYGQVFPLRAREGRAEIELHFFHLWAKDCGRLGHDLDAEHVSAIVSAARSDAPPAQWVATSWYAAAHEGSACDASSAAAAGVIDAIASGPRVFVSRGKHASYFDRGQCKWGCGGDECGDDRAVVASTVINIGEADAPLNGALWVQSPRWPMAQKLSSDFTADLRLRLEADDADHVIPLMQHLRGPQAPVLAGDTALDGLATAAVSARNALATASRAVSRFVRSSKAQAAQQPQR